MVIVLLLAIAPAEAVHTVWWFIPADTASVGKWMEVIQQEGGVIRFRSSWMPVFSAVLDEKKAILLASEELSIVPVQHLHEASLTGAAPSSYSKALEQMQGKAFVRAGLSGIGVKIGITDAGFLFLNDSSQFYGLHHLWSGHQIKAIKDYCAGSDTIAYDECYYTGKSKPMRKRKNGFARMMYEFRIANHRHGSDVLNAIAGYNDKTGVRSGLAPDAEFYLTRTDFGYTEHIDEEDYYIRALEWLAAKGVRLVNTSLGYTRGRKVKSQNYSPYQMNGTSMLARAVEIAVKEKNILVVAAAGNEALKSTWRVIATPGDAPSALTVGAYDFGYLKADYSSYGPDYNTYLKPEVAAFSQSGTSFSAPAVCGFAACLLEVKPELTAIELKKIILRSCILYPYGNNYVGYGVPLATRALALLANPDTVFQSTTELEVTGNEFQFSDPGQLIPYLTVYHKYNKTQVMGQNLVYHEKNKPGVIMVKRPQGCKYSTIQAGYKIIEIVWKDE